MQSVLDNPATGTPLAVAEISSTGELPPLPLAAPTTAKTSSPPEPGTLLENINTAMAEVTSVYTEAKLVVKPNRESNEELVSIYLEGEIETDPDGDGQMVFTVAINRSVFAGSFSGERRRVDGVFYSLEPKTGQWEIDEVVGETIRRTVVTVGVPQLRTRVSSVISLSSSSV